MATRAGDCQADKCKPPKSSSWQTARYQFCCCSGNKCNYDEDYESSIERDQVTSTVNEVVPISPKLEPKPYKQGMYYVDRCMSFVCFYFLVGQVLEESYS